MYDGYQQLTKQDDDIERDLQIYHGKVPVLSKIQLKMAELVETQSLLQRLFCENFQRE